ncbi:MAG: hypothetical protein LBL74_01420 [Bacteroidales bacterium]|jgi:hypothetical protein|nr:hypothetical protein [Bacteroidales bacterium]
MSEDEREQMMQLMRNNFDCQDEPKLGIFWYDKFGDELFGVVKIEATDVPYVNDKAERKTIKSLHKSWWKKQEMRLAAGKEKNAIFRQDYTQIPRGRIFQRRDGTFEIMCGSWMDDNIKELIIDEFDLQKQKVEIVIDEHWELGHGWSEDM